MAVNIENENEDTQYYEEHNLATQGNIVNTIKSYNEQVKKEYNDKNDDKLNNNTLQESLCTVVKALDKSNPISGNFISNNPVKALNYDSGNYGDSGLLRKVEIMSKAITPELSNINDWGNDIHANDLSKSLSESYNSLSNVPLVAKVKAYGEESMPYGTNKKFNESFSIEGTEQNSQQYVLSERQISDMILTVSKDIIEDYSIRLIQLRNMIKNNNSKLLSILNYIIGSSSKYKDYFPVSVSYNEDKETDRKEYTFVTLNSIEITIPSYVFTNNKDKVYLAYNTYSDEVEVLTQNTSNKEGVEVYCNITIAEGKFIVRETEDINDKGYELLLSNYPVYIIIKSDIDLRTLKDAILYINGNPRYILPKEIFPSEERNFEYRIELLPIEGQDLELEFKYYDDDFKGITKYTIRENNSTEEEITKDKKIVLKDNIAEERIFVDISYTNFNNIIYYLGYPED